MGGGDYRKGVQSSPLNGLSGELSGGSIWEGSCRDSG